MTGAKGRGKSRGTGRQEGAQAGYYPVFLDLRGKPCVVVGGGKVAQRKALGLLKAGASVKLISPEATPRLEKEAAKPGGPLKFVRRAYRKSDTKGAFLVIAATGSHSLNQKVSKDATCPVNVADTPGLCDFILPSTVQRGLLTIAVSTSGASPAMASAIRKEIEEHYPKQLGPYLDEVREKRQAALSEIPNEKKRQKYLKSLAAPDVLEKIRQGLLP